MQSLPLTCTDSVLPFPGKTQFDVTFGQTAVCLESRTEAQGLQVQFPGKDIGKRQENMILWQVPGADDCKHFQLGITLTELWLKAAFGPDLLNETECWLSRRQVLSPAKIELSLSHTFRIFHHLDLLKHGLNVKKEPMAVAEQLKQMPRPERTTCIVNQFPGGRQTIWLDHKLFPLDYKRRRTSE